MPAHQSQYSFIKWLKQKTVHGGILDCYLLSGMGDEITAYVKTVMSGRDSQRVMVCGHSLGGGLAHLSAYELATKLGIPPDRISCHTIGCARIFGGPAAREVEDKGK